MKKVLVFTTLIILLGGCAVNLPNPNYDKKIIDKAKKTAESYLRNNYENVNEVEFSNDTSDPMGEIMIRGSINGEAEFSVSIDSESFTVRSLAEKENFPERKEECKEKACDY